MIPLISPSPSHYYLCTMLAISDRKITLPPNTLICEIVPRHELIPEMSGARRFMAILNGRTIIETCLKISLCELYSCSTLPGPLTSCTEAAGIIRRLSIFVPNSPDSGIVFPTVQVRLCISVRHDSPNKATKQWPSPHTVSAGGEIETLFLFMRHQTARNPAKLTSPFHFRPKAWTGLCEVRPTQSNESRVISQSFNGIFDACDR